MSEIRVTEWMIEARRKALWPNQPGRLFVTEIYRAMRQAEMDEEAEARADRMKARENV